MWSLYQKYEEQLQVCQKKLEKATQLANKSKDLIASLDKPFNLMQELEKVNGVSSSAKKPTTSAVEYQWADKIEAQIKSTLKTQVIKWVVFTKFMLYILIGLSFINMFTRADFINMLIPVYILAMLSSSLSNKLLDNLKLFLIVATVTLGTDFLWLFFRSSGNKSDGGNEDGLRSFVYFCSFVEFVVKAITVLALWIQKLKLERGNKEGLDE